MKYLVKMALILCTSAVAAGSQLYVVFFSQNFIKIEVLNISQAVFCLAFYLAMIVVAIIAIVAVAYDWWQDFQKAFNNKFK